MITVQLFKGNGIQPYYLRFVAENGQTLFTSEGYFSRWNAKRAYNRLVEQGQTLRFVDVSKRAQ
jgi:uncharacterized protein YegP (UPF0339 family)